MIVIVIVTMIDDLIRDLLVCTVELTRFLPR